MSSIIVIGFVAACGSESETSNDAGDTPSVQPQPGTDPDPATPPEATGNLNPFAGDPEFEDRGNGVFCPVEGAEEIVFHITSSTFACLDSNPASAGSGSSLPGRMQQAQTAEEALYAFAPGAWTDEDIDAVTTPMDADTLKTWIWERSSSPDADRSQFESDLDEAADLVIGIANGRDLPQYFTAACEQLSDRSAVDEVGLRYFRAYYTKAGPFNPNNWASLANPELAEREWPVGLIDSNQELREFSFDEAFVFATELIAKYDAVDEGEEFGSERRRPAWDSGSVYGDGLLTIDQATNVVASELEIAFSAQGWELPPCYLETVRLFAESTVAAADERLDVGPSEIVDYVKCARLGVRGAADCSNALVEIGDVVRLELTPTLSVIRYDSADPTVAQTPGTVAPTETVGCTTTEAGTGCTALVMQFDTSEALGKRTRFAAVEMTVNAAGVPTPTDRQYVRRFARPLPETMAWDDLIGSQYVDEQAWYWDTADPGCVPVEEDDECYGSSGVQSYPDGSENIFGFSLFETVTTWSDASEFGRPNHGIMLSDVQLPRENSTAAYTIQTDTVLLTLFYDVF